MGQHQAVHCTASIQLLPPFHEQVDEMHVCSFAEKDVFRNSCMFWELEGEALQGCAICLLRLRILLAFCASNEKPRPGDQVMFHHDKPQIDDILRGRIQCGAIHAEVFTPISMQKRVLHELNQLRTVDMYEGIGFYGTPVADPRVRRLISGRTGSTESHRMAAKWLQDCSLNHFHKCSSSDRSPLPKRVLDISSSSVYLHESSEEYGRYACLSYCWGSPETSKFLRTTTQNLHQFKICVRNELLPQTFVDAIVFCRHLNIRWLWIDSLCIIQDDAEDWDREAEQMAAIFSSSYVTLAASASSDVDGGCYTRSNDVASPQQIAVAYPNLLYNGQGIPVYTQLRRKHDVMDKCFPLSTRGWVLQEWLLSPRTIHSLGPELAWECRTLNTCECRHPDEDPDDTEHEITTLKQSLYNCLTENGAAWWGRIVRDYTERNLTYSSDIFPAFSGLAKKRMEKNYDSYLAGLWRSTLVDDLLWHACSKHPNQERCRARPWRAFTWSWASLDNASVSYSTSYFRDFTQAKIINAKCVPKGHDPTGAISSGRLSIRGRAVQATVLTDVNYIDGTYSVAIDGVQQRYSINEDIRNKHDSSRLLPGSIVTLLCMKGPNQDQLKEYINYQNYAYGCFLVLRQIPQEDGVYERVGILERLFLHCSSIPIYGKMPSPDDITKHVLEEEERRDKLGRESVTNQDSQVYTMRAWKDMQIELFQAFNNTAPSDFVIV